MPGSSGHSVFKWVRMYKILLVEDDQVIAQEIQKHMDSWGYETHIAGDFQDIVGEFAALQPQLVLLDISLPFYNGYHWCDEIRKITQVQIIFLSSAADNMNVIMALSRGADDFIAKPFELEILTVKVQAIMRRAYSMGAQSSLLEHKGAVLNLSDTTLSYQQERLELTKNDFRILQILFENSGKVVSREAIMTRLWESDSYIDDNTLTVNVTRLRRKLEQIGLVDFIITKKGLGYMI